MSLSEPFAVKVPGSKLTGVRMQSLSALLDGSGRRVYHDSTLLHVTVTNGTLLGIENGDLADVTEYTADYRRAYRGQLMIYAATGTAVSFWVRSRC